MGRVMAAVAAGLAHPIRTNIYFLLLVVHAESFAKSCNFFLHFFLFSFLSSLSFSCKGRNGGSMHGLCCLHEQLPRPDLFLDPRTIPFEAALNAGGKA